MKLAQVFWHNVVLWPPREQPGSFTKITLLLGLTQIPMVNWQKQVVRAKPIRR